jgi:glycosyltransferase involved in cell wall biosynthesis
MVRVLHIGNHLCPRTAKLARVQHYRDDVRPYRLGFQVGYPNKFGMFALNCIVNQQDLYAFQQALEELDDKIDIIHYHNEPDWPVKFIKARTDKPVIWDVHDLLSLRTGKLDENELAAYQNCDGILTVGEDMLDEVNRNNVSGVPTGWWGTYVPESMFAEPKDPHEDELFLCTGLNDFPGHYRNWVQVFTELQHDFTIMTISARWPIPEAYQKLEIFAGPPTAMENLIKYQSECEAALVGFPYRNKLGDKAMPNKLFEAMAAGIPVICFDPENSLTMSKFIRHHEIGVVVKRPSEVRKAMKQIRKRNMRKNVLKVRKMYSMDSQERIVFNFYKTLLGR